VEDEARVEKLGAAAQIVSLPTDALHGALNALMIASKRARER
jgi:hypothetical protein